MVHFIFFLETTGQSTRDYIDKVDYIDNGDNIDSRIFLVSTMQCNKTWPKCGSGPQWSVNTIPLRAQSSRGSKEKITA
jgi:hypothetical protein